MKGLKNGDYNVEIVVRDEANKSVVNLIANSVEVFNKIPCDKCEKKMSANIKVTEGKIDISDDCQSDCSSIHSRMSTIKIT